MSPSNDYLSELARLLIRERMDKGETQGHIADEIGVSRQTMSTIVRGATVSTMTLIKLLDSMGYELILRRK